MSYNIDTQNVKLLENLVMPLSALYASDRKDWHPEEPKIENSVTMLVTIELGCEQTIKGHLIDGYLHINDMQLCGEGSGGLFHYVLNHAFEQSTGKFHCIFVWEGGDSITRFESNDGIITQTEIEL